MAFIKNNLENDRNLVSYRRLLLVAAGFYLLWWFAVHWILPSDFNPLLSRMLVVTFIFGIWTGSFALQFIRDHIQVLFRICCWLITLHYYYLFYENQGRLEWVIGAYITVMAVSLLLNSLSALILYSSFVIILSLALGFFLPSLSHSVFLPGMITILFQANLGSWSRLKTLKAMTVSSQQFQLLFNSTFEGVMVHSNRRILSVNEPFAKMFGYSKDELVGKDAMCMIHPDGIILLEEKIKEDAVDHFETKGITKDGVLIEIEVSGKTFIYNEISARLVTFQNISDRKRAERERLGSQTLAERVRVQNEFISIASHELKTPLTSLQLQTQNMERGIDKEDPQVYTPERVRSFVQIASRQVRRLKSLIEAMLDVSRISLGKLQLTKEKIDIVKLINEIMALQPSPLISLSLPKELIIFGDQYRIEQVVENLISNALKYGDEKPVYITLREENGNASLTVKDQGIGIDPQILGKIFNQFERGANVKNIGGLGLGLFIARQIVESHGGKISAQSELGKGSTFTVLIPT